MTLAEATICISGGEPFAAALGRFLDAFFDADPEARQAMIDDVPLGLDDPWRENLLTAVGEHLALLWGLEVPDWAREPRHLPTEEHVLAALSPPTPRSDSRWIAPAFVRRGLAIRGEPLLGNRQPPELDGFLLTPVGAPLGHWDVRLRPSRRVSGGG